MKDIRVKIKLKNNLILERAEQLWGKGISQSEIARRCGVRPTEIGNYLNFKQNPRCRMLRRKGDRSYPDDGWRITTWKLAKALVCLPEDLFPENLMKERPNKYEFSVDSKEMGYLERVKTPEEIAGTKEIINQALLTLTPREEKIIRMRFGIGEDGEYSLSEIADDFGVSKERIRQLEYRAFYKMRRAKGIRSESVSGVS